MNLQLDNAAEFHAVWDALQQYIDNTEEDWEELPPFRRDMRYAAQKLLVSIEERYAQIWGSNS